MHLTAKTLLSLPNSLTSEMRLSKVDTNYAHRGALAAIASLLQSSLWMTGRVGKQKWKGVERKRNKMLFLAIHKIYPALKTQI